MRFLFVVLILPFCVHAQETVDIFGQAKTATGKSVQAFESFDQPQMSVFCAPNVPEKKQKAPVLPDTMRAQKTEEINQFSPQNPKPFSISPQKEKNEIENTLYEGGGRIYDVQSFPVNDIKTITEPNIDPTISTYPEY